MTKEMKHNLMGMAVYILIVILFGEGYALLALIVHEDNDRCHYYEGKWNKEDLCRGCIAIALGMGIRHLIL